ncbi:hypothetical protein [Streptomyces sp. NPDC048473]|uniref:hypothetical protein n=1 Tax=unclassified Streptomyces TaxID=2593676 RepID=UPI0037151DA1
MTVFELGDALWGENQSTGAVGELRTCVSRLRRVLAEAALCGSGRQAEALGGFVHLPGYRLNFCLRREALLVRVEGETCANSLSQQCG